MEKIAKKLLVDAPLRGMSNAIAGYVKDSFYPKGRRYSYGGPFFQVPQAGMGQVQDPITGVVEGVKKAVPSIVEIALVALGIYVAFGFVSGVVRSWRRNDGGFSGAPAGCRCVQWVCD